MKIDWIHIKNTNGIHDLKLPFKKGLNLICGRDGVGKTAILECISHFFHAVGNPEIKRNPKFETEGRSISVDGDENGKLLYVRETRRIDYGWLINEEPNLYLILEIIKEIEGNFPKMKASEFDGVILIDELDARLHPSCQGELLKVLKETFQNAQIIATTHSPHMIQAADAGEVIALGLTDDSQVVRLETTESEYGFKGWTIEEILEDVMGMKDTHSNEYTAVTRRFEKALDDEDYTLAKESYDILVKMLHPRNPMRKILEIHLAAIGV